MTESEVTPDLGWLLRRILSPAHPAAELNSDAIEIDSDVASRLWASCSRNRLEPLLEDAVVRGTLTFDPEVTDALHRRVAAHMATMVRLEAAALQVCCLLGEAGIDVRVLKGMATAHLDYPNPALRHFADVDLLVQPEEFDDALVVLEESDIRQKYSMRGGYWQVQHSMPISVGEFEIDLHHRLLHQAAGHLMARADLFADTESFVIAGTELRALPAPLRLIQAAGQNVLSVGQDKKSSSDADILLLLHVVDEAYELANSVDLGWLLDAGLSRAASVAEVPPPPSRSEDGPMGRIMRRAYESGQPSVIRSTLLEAITAPPSTTARVLWSAVAPGEDYLRVRGRTRSDQLRHQVSRASSGLRSLARREAT